MLLPFLQGISFATAPLMGISPFKIFVLSTAIRQGWRRALPLSLAPLIADIPVILILWLLLRQFPEWAIAGLRTIGGVFYLYLATVLFRTARMDIDDEFLAAESRRSFWQAITAVWITPNIYINWSVIGIPALIGYAALSPAHAAVFIFGFYVVFVPGLAFQIFVVGQAHRVSRRAQTYLVVAGSLLLVGFGLYQTWIGAMALIGV